MSIFAKKSDIKQQPPEAKQQSDVDFEVERTPTGNGGVTGYGIGDAIRLMRSLPVDQNIDLVVRVVRVTLSSVNVRIEDIVEDATRRQKVIQDNIAALHEKVASLEEELEARRRDIAAQETDFKETTSVKERLLLAEKGGTFTTGQPRSSGAAAQNHNGAADPLMSPQPPPPPPGRLSLPKPSQKE